MKRSLLLFNLLFLIVLTPSCEFEEPELIRMEDLKVTKFTKDKIILAIRAKVRNPNNYKVSLVNTDLDIEVNGVALGKAALVNKVSLNKNSTDSYLIELENVPENFTKMGLATLGSVFTGGKLTLAVKGTVKGKARLVSKKFDVDFKHSMRLPNFSGTN